MLKVLILNALLFFHPVHVTLITINQARESDTLKVFFRMYLDDFLRDYKLYDPAFKPEKNGETDKIPDELIKKYFNDRVQIYINHKLLPGSLSKVSTDSYEIRLDLVYQSDKRPRNFKIRNQILISLYSDQANMVYLNINKYENAIKLTVDHFDEELKVK
ncbi:MAG: DUF6702 family protein [Bacteroidales bacterium]